MNMYNISLMFIIWGLEKFWSTLEYIYARFFFQIQLDVEIFPDIG